MFEKLWQSLGDVARGTAPPEDRRDAMVRMKETLVRARMGLDDLRDGVRVTEERLVAERAEVATAERRRMLAERIHDVETVALADRFAKQHGDRVDALTAKLAAQQQELALVAREVEEMSAELRATAAGIGPAGASSSLDAERAADDAADPDGSLASTMDAMGRAQRRAAQEQHADDQLAELKRRMGK